MRGVGGSIGLKKKELGIFTLSPEGQGEMDEEEDDGSAKSLNGDKVVEHGMGLDSASERRLSCIVPIQRGIGAVGQRDLESRSAQKDTICVREA